MAEIERFFRPVFLNDQLRVQGATTLIGPVTLSAALSAITALVAGSVTLGGDVKPRWDGPLQKFAVLDWVTPANGSLSTSLANANAVAFDGRHLWVAGNSAKMVKIDPLTGRELLSVSVGTAPLSLLYAGGYLWVANFTANTVSVIEPVHGTTVATVAVGVNPEGLTSDGTHVWTGNGTDDTVSKIRISDRTVVGTYAVPQNPDGLAFDGSKIWVSCFDDDVVVTLDPTTGAVTGTFPVGNGPTGIAFDGTYIWVANGAASTVSKLLASTGALISTSTVGFAPRGVIYDGTSIWVATTIGAVEIRPSDGAILQTVSDLNGLRGIAFDGVNIWVARSDTTTVLKIPRTTAYRPLVEPTFNPKSSGPIFIATPTGAGQVYTDGFLVSEGLLSAGLSLWYNGGGNTTTYMDSRHDSASAVMKFRLRASGTPVEVLTLTGAGKVGIGTAAPTSPLQVVGLPVYANNASAVSGGLTVGALYRTNGDPDVVCVVHA